MICFKSSIVRVLDDAPLCIVCRQGESYIEAIFTCKWLINEVAVTNPLDVLGVVSSSHDLEPNNSIEQNHRVEDDCADCASRCLKALHVAR